jgi:formylglycine-generating enzyme required for sulfatase activity
MKSRNLITIAAVLFAALTISVQPSAQADTFGSGANTFTIDFVSIGNAGNAADTTGYGAVPYEYRMGTYEISQDAIDKATASGMANVTTGPWTGNQPATTISWYEAAAFVNWLNTSTGRQAAYDLTFSGSWSMNLWSSGDAWQLGGENLYRHKDAFYFLPSENEWYKAAYYNPDGANYFLYPTGSDIDPIPVGGGTDPGTAVYAGISLPTIVDSAGGLSPYGTMGQGGNVWERTETAEDGTNSSSSEARVILGGDWKSTQFEFQAISRGGNLPWFETPDAGFRVASVPEPSTYTLLAMSAASALWWARRRR